jgi:micrococcal nuclease
VAGIAVLGLGGCRAARPAIVVERAPTTRASAPFGAAEVPPVSWRGPGRVVANAVVVRSIDGDTIGVRLGGEGDGAEETVRLIGIDTPETKRPDTPVQCFGPQASAATAAVLPDRTLVRLEIDVEERDRYGRLLAYVYRADDGLFVNLELARRGYAQLLTYPPNVAHVDELVAAVSDARADRLGLWAACGPG